MIPYVSRTGSSRTLAALELHGWRLMVNAYGVLRHEGFPYAMDCGTVEQHAGSDGGIRHRDGWEEARFVAMVEKLGRGADWIVLPDIVRGGLASLDLSSWWSPWVGEYAMPLCAVQDGMEPRDLHPLLEQGAGLFLGGSTDWKWDTLPAWARLAREAACYIHVGRVNSYRRISTAKIYGADSIDGTCALFSKHIPMLTNAVRQETLGIR